MLDADLRKWHIGLLLVMGLMLSCGVSACGEGGRGAAHASSGVPRSSFTTSTEPGTPATYTRGPGGYVEGDEDGDDISHSHKDADDRSVREYGHEAGELDLRAVTKLVKRYYQAGAAVDGARACTLIYRPVAEERDFANIAPKAYAEVSGSALFREKNCREVESILFELNHRTLLLGVGTVTVASLRVKDDHGIALLAFKTMPEREIAVEREHGRWTIDALLDSELL